MADTLDNQHKLDTNNIQRDLNDINSLDSETATNNSSQQSTPDAAPTANGPNAASLATSVATPSPNAPESTTMSDDAKSCVLVPQPIHFYSVAVSFIFQNNNLSTAQQSLKQIAKILQTIAKRPAEKKNRQQPQQGIIVKKFILGTTGGLELMKTLGFEDTMVDNKPYLCLAQEHSTVDQCDDIANSLLETVNDQNPVEKAAQDAGQVVTSNNSVAMCDTVSGGAAAAATATTAATSKTTTTKTTSSEPPQRCASGCGFFANANTNGFCSSCFKRQPAAAATQLPRVGKSNNSSAQSQGVSIPVTKLPSSLAAHRASNPNRCHQPNCPFPPTETITIQVPKSLTASSRSILAATTSLHPSYGKLSKSSLFLNSSTTPNASTATAAKSTVLLPHSANDEMKDSVILPKDSSVVVPANVSSSANSSTTDLIIPTATTTATTTAAKPSSVSIIETPTTTSASKTTAATSTSTPEQPLTKESFVDKTTSKTLRLCQFCANRHRLEHPPAVQVQSDEEQQQQQSPNSLENRKHIVKLRLDALYYFNQTLPARQEDKTRCFECRRKVGITGTPCRCGYVYCGIHRYPQEHDCSYDHVTHYTEQLRKKNEVVKNNKLDDNDD